MVNVTMLRNAVQVIRSLRNDKLFVVSIGIQTISIIQYCSMDEFPRFSLSKKSSLFPGSSVGELFLIFLLFGVTGCVTWNMARLVFALPTDLS